MIKPPPKPTPIFWPELSDDVLPPEERRAVEEFRKLRQEIIDHRQYRLESEEEIIFPLFQAPSDFIQFIERGIATTLYADESNIPRKKPVFLTPNINKPPFLPDGEWSRAMGFTVVNGHVVAAMIGGFAIHHQPSLCPNSLGNLRYLQALVLGGGLSNITPSIGQCTQLRYLNLSGNRLSTLPAEIGQCTQLEALDIERASLTCLPPEIGQLHKLKYLDLNENHLGDLPPTFDGLHALLRVDLSSNRFIEFPRVLSRLPQLEWLNLQLNQIGYVPPEIFSYFPAMREMSLGDNPLRTIHGIIQADLRGPYHVWGWGAFNFVQLTPRAMNWLNHYEENKTRYDLEAYYAKSVGELTMELVRTGHLTVEETERLIHEATVDERAVLEHHLPLDHSILQQITARMKIPLTSDHEILL